MATKKPEMTGSRAATAASNTLRDPNASARAKSAAASALTQVRAQHEETRAKAASAASAVLRSPTSTPQQKSAAASALTQAPNRPKPKQ